MANNACVCGSWACGNCGPERSILAEAAHHTLGWTAIFAGLIGLMLPAALFAQTPSLALAPERVSQVSMASDLMIGP
jgi:hypothetical protein